MTWALLVSGLLLFALAFVLIDFWNDRRPALTLVMLTPGMVCIAAAALVTVYRYPCP